MAAAFGSVGICEQSTIVASGKNSNANCLVFSVNGGGYVCQRGPCVVRLKLSPSVRGVRVVSCFGREVVGGIGDGGLELASSFSGEIVAIINQITTDVYSVGTHYVVWNTVGGIVCIDLLDTSYTIRSVFPGCQAECSFEVLLGDVLAVVQNKSPCVVHKVSLAKQHPRVTRCRSNHVLSIPTTSSNIGCLTEHADHVYYARNTNAGVVMQRHSLKTGQFVSLELPCEPTWVTIDVSSAVVTVMNERCFCLRYDITSLQNELIGRYAIVSKNTCHSFGACTAAAVSVFDPLSKRVMLHHDSGDKCVWEFDDKLRCAKLTVPEHSGGIEMPPSTRKCRRCGAAHLERNMGIKYCAGCSHAGTSRHSFGVAVQYAASKFKFKVSGKELNVMRAKLWGRNPTCWLTGATNSTKTVLVFAPIDPTSKMSMSNMCIIKRALVSSYASSVLQRRHQTRLARELSI